MIPERLIRSLFVFLILFTSGSLAAATDFGDPRGFLSNESVVEKALHSGVRLYEVRGNDGDRAQTIYVVKADVSQPHLKLQALAGERQAFGTQYFARSTVSQLHEDNDAFVTINSAFFDISNPGTQMPTGALLQNKKLLRSPTEGQNILIVDDENQPKVAAIRSANRIRSGDVIRPVLGVNLNSIGADDLIVYQRPWHRSPGNDSSFTKDFAVTEVLVGQTSFLPPRTLGDFAGIRGRILEVRDNKSSVPIGENQFVITGTGRWGAYLQSLDVGSNIDFEWSLSAAGAGVAGHQIDQALSGGAVLIRNGQNQSKSTSHWNAAHPRSSIGISRDGSEIVIVMVEGRMASNGAAGMSLHRLIDFHRHMNVYNALEFDGGGSSSIAARVDGANVRLNRPSDGSERYVPAGLGLMLVDEPLISLFRNIRVSSGENEAVITWETAGPAVAHVKFGEVDLDRTTSRDSIRRTRHLAFLTGLKSGKNYARIVAEVAGRTFESPLIEVFGGGGSEIVVDDKEAEFEGSWTSGTSPVPWEESYQFAGTVTGRPTRTATFRPTFSRAGLYDVFVWYTHGGNRASDANYEIRHKEGSRSVAVDQTSGGGSWQLLAEDVSFESGNSQFVRLNNQSRTSGKVVIADAVRWVATNLESESEEVPDWWLEHFFGEERPDLSEDFDGDGQSIRDEFLWGTDPTDPESRFRVQFEVEGDQARLMFSPFHEGRTYRLLRSSDLDSDSWEPVSGATLVRQRSGEGFFRAPIPSGNRREFYRIEIE